MNPSVLQGFSVLTKQFESRENCMYLDIEGLVTTGEGNLIDPLVYALKLPWRIVTNRGCLATPGQIETEWETVKSFQDHKNGPTSFWRDRAKLVLADSDIDFLVDSELKMIATQLEQSYLEFSTAFTTWPADAQLGLLLMAWAIGAGEFREFVHFRAACGRQDFEAAAGESHIDDAHNPGLKPRNKAVFDLFENAAAVKKEGRNMDPAQLVFPKILKIS
jgi:hypothetical protein